MTYPALLRGTGARPIDAPPLTTRYHPAHALRVRAAARLPAPMTQSLADRLRSVDVFDRLDPTTLAAIADQGDMVDVAAGQVLLSQGDVADAMYVVLAGRLAVVVQARGGVDQTVTHVGPGSVVGEVALVAGGTRSATVRAVEDTEVARLSARAVTALLDRVPDVAAALADLVTRRLQQTRLARHLAALFDRLDAESLAAVEAAVQWVSLRAGEVLFRQGDAGDAAYLVVSGRLRAAVSDSDAETVDPAGRAPVSAVEVTAGEVVAGELVGEQALITGDRRAATVYATRDSELARLPQTLFETLALRHPRGMLEITRTVIARQARPAGTRRRLPDQLSVMVVPSGADLLPFVPTLAGALSTLGATAVLSSDRLDTDLGEPGASQAEASSVGGIRVRQRLSDVEASHRFVVYVADTDVSPWTSRCLRQADVVVAVADAGADPSPRPWEQLVVGTGGQDRSPRRLQVLLHAAGTGHPRGTRRWLEQRPGIESVHHVRRGHDGDIARLARIVAGEAVGLVLSGGGARAYAHLGVLDALDEIGIPVDLIGGTSMGSIMGLVEALEIPRPERVARARRATQRLLDYTLPMASLVSGRRLTAMLSELTHGLDIEDLWTPYFCVSTSLTTSQPVVHRRGAAARAIRCSISIPGVMPPVPVDGELLVDGGLLNNLPVTIMRGVNPTGPVIASDVVPPVGPSAKGDWGPAVSGWRVLASRLPGRPPLRIPSIANTLLRSTIVASNRLRDGVVRNQLADCYLDLDVRGLAVLELDSVEHAARVGFEGSVDRLSAWWRAENGRR